MLRLMFKLLQRFDPTKGLLQRFKTDIDVYLSCEFTYKL